MASERRNETPSKSIDELMEEAKAMPGVAEAMEVYRRSEMVMERALPYLRAIQPKVVYTTSTGSS